MKLEKGADLLESNSREAKSAFICSYLINPLTLKKVLGERFPYDALILYSGEKTVDVDRDIGTRKFLDASSIPLLAHAFHSKLYLFEHDMKDGTELDLIVASFNATSAGLNQNLEFWVAAKAKIDLAGLGVGSLVELVLDPRVDVDAISWNDFCSEEEKQLVVAPALEVLWRLAKNGVGLVPGTPRCISDQIIAENHYSNYDSIFVHTLGNNSLSKAIGIMIREAADNSNIVTIRVVSPYHNVQGLKYLLGECRNIIGKRRISVNVQVLTSFPPDFPNKFGDPEKQSFATKEDVASLTSEAERVKLSVKLWKQESGFSISNLDETLNEFYVQNVFLHGKAILVKSEKMCQALVGSPNITDAAIGKGPDLNFETAVWERRNDVASSLWKDLDSLFRLCTEAKTEDYDIMKTWKAFFSSGEHISRTTVSGPRDAIGRYVKFLVEKETEVTPLYIHKEQRVYFDEIDHASLLCVMEAGAPRIESEASVFFTPSKLEETKETQSRFVNGRLSTSLLLDRSKPDTISIRVDIESKLIEEYEVNIKEKENKIEVVSAPALIWNQADEEATLQIETQNGPIEIPCTIDGPSLIAEKSAHKITNRDAFLRIYSKTRANRNSFGYFRIRYRKREPKIEAKLACVTPFPFSVYFKEFSDPLSAKIDRKSISIFLLTEDHKDIAAIPLATRTISDNPIIQSFLMRFSQSEQTAPNELHVEARFEDEHGGYYNLVLPAQKLGYSKTRENEIDMYVPEEMARELFLASSSTRARLTSKPDGNGFNHFVIPNIPVFCDRDDNRLWILEDFITNFHSTLENQRLLCFPDRANIVDSAPIILELPSFEIPEHLRGMCNNMLLRWWVRSWSKGMGTDKRHSFTLPIRFEISPTEIEAARQSFDASKESFEGYLDIEPHYEMESGYDISCRRETFKVKKTKGFLKDIEEDILNYPKDKRQLLSALVKLIYSQVAANVPFETFRKAVEGDEGALFTLRERYGYPTLVSKGFPLFYIAPGKCDHLLKKTLSLVLDSLSATFSTNPKLPKIPKAILDKVLSKKVERLISSLLMDIDLQCAQLIAPARLFEKFDPKWIEYIG